MLCQICGKNEAAVQFKQVADGTVNDLYICTECAAEHGLGMQSAMGLTDFLFSVESQRKQVAPGEDRACPSCGMKRSDFRKGSLFGCARCYEVFAEDLQPLLDAIQKGDYHLGRVPSDLKVSAEIAALQTDLKKAVALQNFEEAARLRDRIHDLKQQETPPSEQAAEEVES